MKKKNKIRPKNHTVGNSELHRVATGNTIKYINEIPTEIGLLSTHEEKRPRKGKNVCV